MKYVLFAASFLAAGLSLLVGCSAGAATTAPAAPQNAVTVNISAQNLQFDTKSITVPAGAAVTVNFDNEDAGIPHNFAVYQNLSGGQTKPVFVGSNITGPAKTTYHFTAPAAGGKYFFECDVHPDAMNGLFIVD